MYNNNNFGGNTGIGGFQPQGYAAQPMAAPKMNNPLTPEEIKSLRKKVDAFSLGLTREESLRGICVHRDENGNDALSDNGDGTVSCSICGYRFSPVQKATYEDIKADVDEVIDVLQTIKMMYLDMPAEVGREYMQIIPLLEKAPKLFQIASEDFSRHENYNTNRYQGTPQTINLYNMLNNGGLQPQMYQPQPMGGMNAPQSNGFGFMGQPQQPMMQPQMGQPMMNGYDMNQQQMMQQPMYNNQQMNQPMMNQQMAPQNNGFTYTPNQTDLNSQPTGVVNNGNAYGVNNQPLAAPAPAAQTQQSNGNIAPTGATATNNGKDVNVSTQFKA